MECRVLSLAGGVLYEGLAKAMGPVGQRELEVLGLLLASLLLTITVFVFRPAGSGRESVALPEGFALAEPWRRLAAGAIDAGVAVVISATIWNTSPVAIVDLSMMVTSEHGVWPIMTVAGLLIVMGTIGEATTGRMLGKWALGCRVITRSGERPSWRQAVARNTVKAMCPPLAMMAIGPASQGTASSFGTLVIAPIRGEGGPTPGGDDSSQDGKSGE